ncbi:hypothetical protein J6590_074988 [Homalodisca vitripennis]|nr:hypothetical protein J6590_074988 [Homalodisca vitripennis]
MRQDNKTVLKSKVGAHFTLTCYGLTTTETCRAQLPVFLVRNVNDEVTRIM